MKNKLLICALLFFGHSMAQSEEIRLFTVTAGDLVNGIRKITQTSGHTSLSGDCSSLSENRRKNTQILDIVPSMIDGLCMQVYTIPKNNIDGIDLRYTGVSYTPSGEFKLDRGTVSRRVDDSARNAVGWKKLSQNEQELFRLQMLRNIRHDQIIEYKYGNARRRIIYYSAIDCPSCRKFDEAMHSGYFRDVAFIVIPTALHLEDAAKVKIINDILCSSDPANAWREMMINRNRPATQVGCDKRVIDNRFFAAFSFLSGMKGTPTFILPNGDAISTGYPDDLAAALNRIGDSDIYSGPNLFKFH